MGKLLLYCTKGKPNLYMPYEHDYFPCDESSNFYLGSKPILERIDIQLNGTIVGTCGCNLVEKILFTGYGCGQGYKPTKTSPCEMGAKSKLNNFIAIDLCLKGKEGYGLHLSNVEVFDKPKELGDFYHLKGTHKNLFGEVENEYEPVKRAPQNMMYVYDKDGNRYWLISIRPEWLVKILKGEKTIEVRRKILKEMLKELYDY